MVHPLHSKAHSRGGPHGQQASRVVDEHVTQSMGVDRCGALVEKDEQVCPGKAWCECAAISVANLGNASESQGVGLNLQGEGGGSCQRARGFVNGACDSCIILCYPILSLVVVPSAWENGAACRIELRASFLLRAASCWSHLMSVKMEGLLQDLACADTANGRPTLAHQVGMLHLFGLEGTFGSSLPWSSCGSEVNPDWGPRDPIYLPIPLCASCPCAIPH